jgi:hypothetical protein
VDRHIPLGYTFYAGLEGECDAKARELSGFRTTGARGESSNDRPETRFQQRRAATAISSKATSLIECLHISSGSTSVPIEALKKFSMKHFESQWKPLEEVGVQVCDGKKWLLLNDTTDRFADEKISI